uniref:C2H2-type domain-containing protein n=1 Tax=Gadus morhua TaxID=8049 RepID=A0A8C5CT45_GADMO
MSLKHEFIIVLLFQDDVDDSGLETAPQNVPGPFVCEQCCEEFSALSDLKHHTRICSSNPQFLVLQEHRTTDPTKYDPVHCIPTTALSGLEESVNTFEMEDPDAAQTEDNKAFENCCTSSNGSRLEREYNTSSSHASGEQQKTDIPLSPSALTSALPQSWISSLMEQILALQMQQVGQLQLTNQICHQFYLFASEKVKIPQSPVGCDQELSSSKSAAPLIDLCYNLSQQLAVAARTAQCLSAQFGNITGYEKLTSTQQQSPGINKTSNSLHFTGSNSQLQINSNPVINIMTTLAEQKNQKAINITLPGSKASSNRGFFKHRCTFCSKLFGSESALQIHVRSHTGERPYKCNICGNRFSTRGNLKVHFQRHKKRYPHIQMNPYPISQHLDNIPTSTGVPYGMSILMQSLGATKQPSLIKQDGVPLLSSSSCSHNVVHLASNVKTTMPTDSAATAQGSVDCHNEGQTSLNLMFERTTGRQGESKDHLSKDISSSCTHSSSTTAIPFLKTSDTSKLQLLLLDDIDKKVSDSYECVVCHRLLSCPGALRTHYQLHIAGGRPYLCKLCGRGFSSKGNLRNHHAVRHVPSTRRVQHSCSVCPKKFTHGLLLQQHVQCHMDGKTYSAPFLNLDISRPMGCNGVALNKQHNTNESLDFSEDSGSSHFKSSLSSSLSSSVSELSHRDDNSITSYGLSQHHWIKKEGERDSTEGKYPAFNLPTFDNLFPNSKLSCNLNSEGPFQTNVSLPTLKFNESSVNPSEIELFNQIKDTPICSPSLCEKGIFKNSACDICGKNFACQSALDIHYRTHTKERPFICPMCTRRFSTKGNLKQHTLTHQMRAPPPSSDQFKCSVVPNKTPATDTAPFSGSQQFKREGTPFPNSLATSGNQREGEAPGLSWSSGGATSALTAPARRTAKQHHCRTCGKAFSSSSALQIHNRTHTGEKPFSCTVCLRAFTTKGNLKVHMGTHMWNCAPTRKGRRLFTSGSLVPIASSPVILPVLQQNNPVTTSKLGIQCSPNKPICYSNILSTFTLFVRKGILCFCFLLEFSIYHAVNQISMFSGHDSQSSHICIMRSTPHFMYDSNISVFALTITDLNKVHKYDCFSQFINYYCCTYHCILSNLNCFIQNPYKYQTLRQYFRCNPMYLAPSITFQPPEVSGVFQKGLEIRPH